MPNIHKITQNSHQGNHWCGTVTYERYSRLYFNLWPSFLLNQEFLDFISSIISSPYSAPPAIVGIPATRPKAGPYYKIMAKGSFARAQKI